MEQEKETLEDRRRQLLQELQQIDRKLENINHQEASTSRPEDEPRASLSTQENIPSTSFPSNPVLKCVKNLTTQGSEGSEISKNSTERCLLGSSGKSVAIEDSKHIPQKSYCQNRFATYKKLPGTTDLGREFEQTMCTMEALKLATNDEVDDFEMTSNNVADGKFDDIGLKVTFRNGSSTRFLFQLKHKPNKEIYIGDLNSTGKNNDFGLKKYIESISNMNISEDTVCILFTNCATQIRVASQLENSVTFTPCTSLGLVDFLVNTEEKRENAIFEIKSENLKQKFYLFTSQLNVKKTEGKINSLLKDLLKCDIYGAFISYMRHWWLGNFILTKHDVLAKISELALSPYLRTLTDQKSNQKTESLKEAIMNFSLTIVEECGEDIVENIWKSGKTWTDEEFSKATSKYGLKEHQQNTTLWYLDKIPLVVRVDGSNETAIKCVVNFLLTDLREKRVILTGKVSKGDFKQRDALESLSNIIKNCEHQEHCLDIMKQFKISLQGRGCLTLENLVSIEEEVAKFIGTRELLKMSQQEHLLVGNEKEALPELHIPRTISPVLVKMEDILYYCRSSSDSLVIVNCAEIFAKKLSENGNVKTMELSQYLTGTISDQQEHLILLSTRSQCTSLQFESICERSKKSDVHLLQHFDDTWCILMLSKSRRLKLDTTRAMTTIKESQIFKYYNNSFHVFCAPPGMGKSTLMKALYNSCPPDCLAVYVNLLDCNSFLATKPNFEQIRSRFLQIDEKGDELLKLLKNQFWQKRKLYMFLDGLDEVDSQYIECILEFIKQASSQGGRIWVSSRENLQKRICQTLNAVPVDIKELNEEEQKSYIRCKLEQSYKEQEIENITAAVFKSTDLNNSQNLLGIPLKLHIITEMFLNDRRVYENLEEENLFVLTKMYRTFFEGKIKFSFQKLVDRNLEKQLGHLKYVLYAYELPALKSCLDEEDYEKLDIHANEMRESLDTIKTEGDKPGIIKEINDNDEVTFCHQTYPEYFSCAWLMKNPKKVVSLRHKIFSRRYENLRLMFDVMLAENNPLHLSVIYQNIQQFENHIEDIGCVDEGGRTVFHLAFSYGQKYDFFESRSDVSLAVLKSLKRETSCYVQMIKRLLKLIKIRRKEDRLLKIDCVSYALRSKCLYPIERMLAKDFLIFDEVSKPLYKRFNIEALACCCAQFGFPNLLSELIEEYPHLAKKPVDGIDLLELAILGCEGDVCVPPRKGNVKSVKILLNSGARLKTLPDILEEACEAKCFDMLEILIKNKAKIDDGNTMLHILVKNCPEMYYNEIIETARKFNLDVDARNDDGVTALHKAAESADLKIVEGLLEIGADFEILDDDERSALHYACSNSQKEVLQLFLDRRLDVNAGDENGVVPLHLASEKGRTDNVIMLLKKGAKLNLKDNEGSNALHRAIDGNFCNTEDTIKLLISEGIDINAKTDNGFAPIHCAYERGNFKIADFLSEKGATSVINATFENGNTSLHLACSIYDHPVAIGLLERGADANIVNDDNKNALYYTLRVSYGSALVHAMITHGIDLNTRYRKGRSLLHITCLECDGRNVKKLVERDVDLNVLDDHRQTPLHVVVNSLREMVQSVKWNLKYDNEDDHDHDINSWQFGCTSCYLKLLKSLEKATGDRNFTKHVRERFTKVVGYTKSIDCFLHHVLSNTVSKASHFVARFVIFELINYLIDNGAKTDLVDVYNRTALQYASELKDKYPEIFHLLKYHPKDARSDTR